MTSALLSARFQASAVADDKPWNCAPSPYLRLLGSLAHLPGFALLQPHRHRRSRATGQQSADRSGIILTWTCASRGQAVDTGGVGIVRLVLRWLAISVVAGIPLATGRLVITWTLLHPAGRMVTTGSVHTHQIGAAVVVIVAIGTIAMTRDLASAGLIVPSRLDIAARQRRL